MMKKVVQIGAALAATAALFALTGCPYERGRTNKIVVVTTNFPLYDMARSIGGDKADVSLLLPPGVEPHAFEPTPGDIVRINEADMFVYTGRFMEPWAAGVVKGATNSKLLVVDASSGVQLATASSRNTGEHAGAPDPHIWLDFADAKIMAMNIKAAFEARDREHADFYEKTAGEYAIRLDRLDKQYRDALSSCRSREIVYGGHYAFGYLAARYGLKYIAAQGLSPDAEPSARDLTSLVDQIRKDGVTYVFYEELTSPKIAETVARETKAKLLLLNAAHNIARDQRDRGVTFFEIMTQNLENLKTGLGCK